MLVNERNSAKGTVDGRSEISMAENRWRTEDRRRNREREREREGGEKKQRRYDEADRGRGWLNDDRSTGIDTGEGKRKIIGKRGDKRVERAETRNFHKGRP